LYDVIIYFLIIVFLTNVNFYVMEPYDLN